MPAGLTANITKAAIDQQAGSIANQVDYLMGQIQQLQIWLVATGSATLVSQYGYTAGDAATLMSAFSDLDQLRQLYHGLVTLAVAKDFTTFSKQIYGLGVH